MVDGSVPGLDIDGRAGDGLERDWRGSLVRLAGTCVLVDVLIGGIGAGVF